MQTILGIDLGTYSVKVAEVRRSFQSFQFINYYERRIQYNEVLTPEESIAAALQGVLEDNALTWDVCFVALPAPLVATRMITLPFGAPKKVEQILPFEVENYLPFALDDVVYDYHIVEATKELSRILIFYTKKIEVAKFLGFVANAGAEPRRLCVGGVELVNLVNMGLTPPEVPYAILDIGHAYTVITVCRGKRLAFTRSVMVGGKHITAGIAKAVGVSLDEAERLKVEMGHVIAHGEPPPPDTIPHKVVQAAGQVVEELLLHLRQTFFSVREEFGAAVEGIYLCGGTARLPGLDTLLSVRLQQNVTFIDCHDFHFTRVERSEVPRESAAGALAMALRGVATTGLPTVDFRKGEFVYRADSQQFEGKARSALIAALLILGLAVASFGIRWYVLRRQVAGVQAEIVQLVAQALPKEEARRLTSAEAAVKALEGAVKDVERRTERIDTLVTQSALDMLRRISAAVPPRDAVQLNVEKFEYGRNQVKVSAMVTSDADLDKIRRTIETNLTEQKGPDGKAAAPADGGTPLLAEFPPAKPGAKGELRFDVILQPKVAAADEKKGKKK